MKIGVFDSGVGGMSVADAIRLALPAVDVVYVEDKANVPYGTKLVEEIYGYVLPILQKLERDGCDIIVIACNTVSTTLLGQLHDDIGVPLVGMEPLVEVAASLTHNGIIAVCATPRTLASARYRELVVTHAAGIEIIEPDCSTWSRLIEDNEITEAQIRATIEPCVQAGADVIVLGCTHYHWIEQEIIDVVDGRAHVTQPEQEMIERLKLSIEDLEF